MLLNGLCARATTLKGRCSGRVEGTLSRKFIKGTPKFKNPVNRMPSVIIGRTRMHLD